MEAGPTMKRKNAPYQKIHQDAMSFFSPAMNNPEQHQVTNYQHFQQSSKTTQTHNTSNMWLSMEGGQCHMSVFVDISTSKKIS